MNPGKEAIVISIVFTVFAFVVVALRLYARACLVRQTGIEDVFIIGAVMCAITITGVVTAREFTFETGTLKRVNTLQSGNWALESMSMNCLPCPSWKY